MNSRVCACRAGYTLGFTPLSSSNTLCIKPMRIASVNFIHQVIHTYMRYKSDKMVKVSHFLFYALHLLSRGEMNAFIASLCVAKNSA